MDGLDQNVNHINYIALENSKKITFKDVRVTTQKDSFVVFASTSEFPLAIPVIVNHSKTRNAIDIVSKDSTDWIVYSNYEQDLVIRMHILPVWK